VISRICSRLVSGLFTRSQRFLCCLASFESDDVVGCKGRYVCDCRVYEIPPRPPAILPSNHVTLIWAAWVSVHRSPSSPNPESSWISFRDTPSEMLEHLSLSGLSNDCQNPFDRLKCTLGSFFQFLSGAFQERGNFVVPFQEGLYVLVARFSILQVPASGDPGVFPDCLLLEILADALSS
jgi:hypothetical protein